jgi:hypothetical protein
VLEWPARLEERRVNLVLKFKGLLTEQAAAEARLRREVPGVVLTRKTPLVVEVQLDDAQAALLKDSSDWDLIRPSYAEVRPPGVNLKNLRAKPSDAK